MENIKQLEILLQNYLKACTTSLGNAWDEEESIGKAKQAIVEFIAEREQAVREATLEEVLAHKNNPNLTKAKQRDANFMIDYIVDALQAKLAQPGVNTKVIEANLPDCQHDFDHEGYCTLDNCEAQLVDGGNDE